jgi:hypothetical protein
MKERPILFSAPMVRALLNGTKTQTRRVFKQKNGGIWPNLNDLPGMRQILRNCPYGQPGDRLWVREAFSGPHHQERHPPRDWHSTDEIHYWADGCPNCGDWTKPRPGMFMPRWASRITLEITEVRVERLQDISEADSIAEGIEHDQDISRGNIIGWRDYLNRGGKCGTANGSYRSLWESINGPGSWEANPWVWVVKFRRI